MSLKMLNMLASPTGTRGGNWLFQYRQSAMECVRSQPWKLPAASRFLNTLSISFQATYFSPSCPSGRAIEMREGGTAELKKIPLEKNTSGKLLVCFTRPWLDATGFHTHSVFFLWCQSWWLWDYHYKSLYFKILWWKKYDCPPHQ